MPNPSEISRGNIIGQWVLSLTISPTTVAANTTAEQTFALSGVQLGDMIEVSKPTQQNGLGIVNARVSAAGVVAIAFGNFTAATFTPTTNENYIVEVTRAVNLNATGTGPLLTVVE